MHVCKDSLCFKVEYAVYLRKLDHTVLDKSKYTFSYFDFMRHYNALKLFKLHVSISYSVLMRPADKLLALVKTDQSQVIKLLAVSQLLSGSSPFVSVRHSFIVHSFIKIPASSNRGHSGCRIGLKAGAGMILNELHISNCFCEIFTYTNGQALNWRTTMSWVTGNVHPATTHGVIAAVLELMLLH